MKSNKSTYKIRTMLAAALLTGAGVFSLSADITGDASLSRLEVRVDGRNILGNFNPSTKTYEVELEEGASSLATFSASPSSKDAVVDININGESFTNHSLGSLRGGENVITYTVKNGTETQTYTVKVKTPEVTRTEHFTWKNANIYFVITDRFYNGDSSNDESYHRHKTAGGTNVATFHGGDIKGLTQKLDYLDNLGVNAIWITAPYEQMHGWTGGKDNAFPHYAFHGYYTLDWTYMDRNMGTIEDMRNFVTEAHKRGIRVVMDIVLNHTGYSTLDDCLDYDFGNFNGNPQAGWVPNDGNYTMWGRSDVSFNADEQGKWGNWWGPFVRAFGDRNWASNAGYAPEGNDDRTKPLAGLPDVVTERTQTVNLPPFLKKKWAAEKGGVWDNYRLPTAEDWRTDGKGAPADYVINWLAAWVEYFGIDGFRCDTAKHVEFSRWNQLKNTCKAALQRWRSSSRADEYAKGWTEDFWMTGEAWGWDHGDTGYFTQGGFDSMINFAFNGTEGGTGRTPTVGDWEYYSNFCNGGNGKQVLNYVSSHDTGLHRPGDQKAVGTMLLLCPGGAQIYYGDETSRPAVDGKGDPGMVTRGDFNWNAVDNDVNKHWQKVGQFRRRNAAVGAGTQTNLGADTYGRKFTENGYSNAVVIRLNTQAGQSYTVNVNGIFSDGQRVMDGYDTSKTATVSGGKVTMTASGPVLLIEEYGTIGGYVPPIPPIPTPTKPVVTASPESGTFSNSVTVSLSVTPATDIYYTLDGTTPSQSSTRYSAPLTFTETTTLKTYAANDAGSEVKTFTYTKQQGGQDDPIDPTKSYVYFVNDKNWDVKVWAWNESANCTASGSWPGDAMTEKNGVLYWEAPAGKVPTQIIFSNNGGDKAGNGDLEFVNGHTYKSDGSHSLVSYGGGDKPVISASPQSGTFSNSVTVSLSVSPATTIYYTLDGTTPSQSSTRYTSPLTFTETTTLKAFATNSAGSDVKTFTYTKQQGGNDDPQDEVYIYFDDTSKQDVTVWAWTSGEVNCTASGTWPGDKMTKKNGKYYWALPAGKPTPTNIIISWGNHGEGTDERAGGSDLEFVNKHTYKVDGTHSYVSYGPQKPMITVSPDGGNVRGTASITVQIDNDATSITGSFNNRTITLGNGSTTLKVSDYLGENQSGTLSIMASNSLGTAIYSGTFKRDDSQPVYTLTGDWRELSIYQIMVASFQHGAGGASGYGDMWGPSGHTKNGNLRGIINSLDYIKELGMNAIWMTPIFDSSNGMGGEKLQATGYFCTNYFKVDPKFGSEAEFDELIREAHNRGIYVILDGVFGHHGGVNSASPNGKWIQTQDNTPNVRGSESGNIVFPGSLEYFKEVIRYWMERGVDGWRLDQCYQAYQGGHNYWNDLRKEAEKVAAERRARGEQWGTLAYMVGEDWTSAGNITTTQQDGLKSVMDFDGKDNLVNLSSGVGSCGWFLSNDAASRGYRDSGVNPTIFLSNHDTDRVGDYVDVNSKPKELMTRHAAVAAYSGPTCTYYGDEIGDKSGKHQGNGNPDNWARTSGRISGFNQNEQMVHDYVAKVFKARAENPALWRGSVQRQQQGNNIEIITKTDSQTGNKVVVIFTSTDANVSIGGSGIDLINGGSVSSTVNVKAWVPAFIKMN